jgi:hypothetical protein
MAESGKNPKDRQAQNSRVKILQLEPVFRVTLN